MILIDDYLNNSGEHCGSGAMRNLITYYCGLDLPESVVFGLGSGIDCIFIENESNDPVASVFGRSVTMEVDVSLALGVDYREQPELDNELAWETVRQEILEGRPTMLTGDVFYLDYRKAKVHFPAHRFVLVGFDDDKGVAFIADRVEPEPQTCSLEALANSRNPPLPISTYNLWGKFHDTTVHRSIVPAHRMALHKTAGRMLGQDASQSSLIEAFARSQPVKVACGLEGIRRLAESLVEWRDLDDRQSLASYASGCIEKYGTGGGHFRTMYSRFLRKALLVVPELVPDDLPELAARSATLWTELAGHLEVLSTGGTEKGWDLCSEVLSTILEIETALFEKLGDKTKV